jgi:hypothetical protein
MRLQPTNLKSYRFWRGQVEQQRPAATPAELAAATMSFMRRLRESERQERRLAGADTRAVRDSA